MSLLIASQILTWIALLALAAILLATVRQVGTLLERIAPAGALAVNSRLKAGDRAPELVARSLDGSTVTIGGARTKAQLLLFVAPDCPVCKAVLPSVRAIARSEQRDVEVVLLSDGEERSHREFVAAQDLEFCPYVLSEVVGKAYGVGKLPYGVVIREDGGIAALGIVNSREHLESLLEAKERGVASLQEYLRRKVG